MSETSSVSIVRYFVCDCCGTRAQTTSDDVGRAPGRAPHWYQLTLYRNDHTWNRIADLCDSCAEEAASRYTPEPRPK